MFTKPSSDSEDPLGKIIVAVVIALLAGGSSPWWWNKVSPPSAPTTPDSFLCSPQHLKEELFQAGSDKSAVVKSRARTMRKELARQNYDCVLDIALVLIENAQDNGHGLYFSGEAWRGKAKTITKTSDTSRGKMRDAFFRYLDNEPRQPISELGGNAEACYQREKGYCAERTAWINHIMANDYYQQAQDSADKATKMHHLERALNFVENDLKFGGFDQLTPSAVLKSKIQEKLQSLRSSGTR